jgi:hypothetical protein
MQNVHDTHAVMLLLNQAPGAQEQMFPCESNIGKEEEKSVLRYPTAWSNGEYTIEYSSMKM